MGNETKTEERQHSLLGASSSHKWLHCTPSAAAEAKYPDTGSDYAREGSLAHAMGARLIKEALGLDTLAEQEETARLWEYHAPDMDEYAAGYAAFVLDRWRQAKERAVRVKGAAPEIRVEQRLDYSEWVPGGFGTGDAVIVGDGEIEVIDLKYGKGVPVSAERNPQMMLYALGAVSLYGCLYEMGNVTMTVYQPRLGNVASYVTPVRDLLEWASDEVAPLARLADKGRGVRQSGEWCRFCKAKGDCATLAAESLDLWQLNKGAELTAADMAEILPRLGAVKDWVKAVEERSLAMALEGEEIPGWKVVAGRSVRTVTDPGLLVQNAALAGYDTAGMFRPRELRTLTELERMFGKKVFAELGKGCVEKPEGKPTLVPESDKRAPLDPFAGVV